MPTTPAVLPASLTPAPSADWAITGYKEIEMGCGVAYSGKLRHSGALVGEVEHQGNGGVPMVRYRPGKAATHRALWDEWAKGLAVLNDDTGEYEYEAIEALVTESQVLAQLKRAAKKGLLALKAGTNPIDNGFTGFTAPATEANIAKLPAEYSHYFDGAGWAEVPRG